MRARTFCFCILVCLYGVACAIWNLPRICRASAALLAIAAALLALKHARCAHCGRYGVNLNPFAKEFGVCKHCRRRAQ